MALQPDADQSKVLALDRGPLLVTGAHGSGKTVVLQERFARLIETGTDPERVALVVRTRADRDWARDFLLERLGTSLSAVRVLTAQGLAFHVMNARYRALQYDQPPGVLTASDQFSMVVELLAGEDPREWPAYGSMLGLRGFADQVRQFLLRAQEALASPGEILERAEAAGLTGWRDLAAFFGRYLDTLAARRMVDFAGLVNQASQVAGQGEPLFDHLMVDDYQEATLALERLVQEAGAASLVVAGYSGSHVFGFQGTTDRPLGRLATSLPPQRCVELSICHRGPAQLAAWHAPHTSEEHLAVARELRRIHVEEGTPWEEMAVVVRRLGSHLGGLLRALDDAGVPRSMPGDGLSLAAEPAAVPFVLAFRWLARQGERDGLVEALLTSELALLSPAAARSLVRAAKGGRRPAAAALDGDDGLTPDESRAVSSLRDSLAAASEFASRSVLDTFRVLWSRLDYPKRLVAASSDDSEDARRDLEGVLALAGAVARAGDGSVEEFLRELEAGEEGPGPADPSAGADAGSVRVLTAHGIAGLEFDTVVVIGAVEGNFPSLSRPEPMFDLSVLERQASQADRNRERLEDERRLFNLVKSRARRRVLFLASDPRGEEDGLTARSRFVAELGVEWSAAPGSPRSDPISVAEAAAMWRRSLAELEAAPPARLAALSGLMALGVKPRTWWFQRDWTGSDRPLHESIRVSYSKLDKLENCALQFVLSEELGLEGAAGYYAWVGHLVHKLIEDCESGVIDRSEEALLAAAEQRWRPQEFPSHAVSESFRRTVTKVMLPAWFAEYGGTPALARELHFEFDFEGATVSGFIDRVGPVQSGGSQITDYKTGRARNVRVDDNLQLGIYYLAVNRAEELEEFRPAKAVELAFLKDIKDGRIARAQLGLNSKAQQEYAAATSEHLSMLVRRLRELEATDVFRPNPAANCRFCDFKPLCPLWPEGRELFPETGVNRG